MNARALAIRVLERVQIGGAFLSLALDSELKRARLDPRDAAFVTELCYGAVRRQIPLDRAVAQFSTTQLSRIEPRVLCALRVGAYQLFYMRLPKRAAVAETVEALKQLGTGRAAGFANALLRKLSQLNELPLPPESDRLAHLAVRESHPLWLAARWADRYGLEATEAMMVANNRAAPVTLRVNSTRITREALLQRFALKKIEARALSVSPAGIVVASPGRVSDLDGYSEGLWQIQDEAAQLVGAYAEIHEGFRVFDACAAPGAKTCQLAERGRVVAGDIHRHKLRKLETEALRLGLRERIELLEHDATLPFPAGTKEFDVVLVDAPCSGLGTLRRHPELKYRRQEEDIARLAKLQRSILENCLQILAPDGVLVYAVCSTEPEEGEEQVSEFLRGHPELALESPSRVDQSIVNGCLRTLPGEQGWDGFFAARLRRLRESTRSG
jgi:16S rRNA (cytosine967-C5)-methyltransferase